MYYLLLTLTVGILTTLSHATDSCELVKKSIASASAIRGLSIKSDVPCKVHSKEGVRQYLTQKLKDPKLQSKLKHEERLYKLLKLIPESYSYVDGVIALYENQVSGFYDAEQNYYALADWMPDLMQIPVAVHELTHALQDQYYNLDTFVDTAGNQNSDELMARAALVEGDATAVMYDYASQQSGKPPLTEREDTADILMSGVASSFLASSPNTPPALRKLMYFPYLSGIRFVHSLLKQGGYGAVDRAFASPPKSTREILHPNDYGKIKPPQLTQPGNITCKSDYQDVIGEFTTAVLLSNTVTPKIASGAAAGLLADMAWLGEGCLVWRLLFDNEGERNEFLSAWQNMQLGETTLEGSDGLTIVITE